jgi:phosphonate transport system substrate-binding protein
MSRATPLLAALGSVAFSLVALAGIPDRKAIDPAIVKVLAKSAPIPYPPLAMHPKLTEAVKTKLRDAFNNIDKLPGITKDQIRGYGGGKVDGYTSKVSEADMAAAGKMFELVTDQVKVEIMKKADSR